MDFVGLAFVSLVFIKVVVTVRETQARLSDPGDCVARIFGIGLSTDTKEGIGSELSTQLSYNLSTVSGIASSLTALKSVLQWFNSSSIAGRLVHS